MNDEFVQWFIENWSAWLGVISTILGLWISYKLRGHPLLSYKVLRPTTAVPGAKIRFQPSKAKSSEDSESMQFKAALTNVGTERIVSPAANEGALAVVCGKGWKFTGGAYADSNGQHPAPTFKIRSDPRFMDIDFKVLEPSQWVEFTYTVARTKSTDTRLVVPVIGGVLKGSISGVRNTRSVSGLLRQAVGMSGLTNSAAVLVTLLTTVLAYWIVDRFVPVDTLWMQVGAIVLIGFFAYRIIIGIAGVMMTFVGVVHPPTRALTDAIANQTLDDEDMEYVQGVLGLVGSAFVVVVLAVVVLIQGSLLEASVVSALFWFAFIALFTKVLFEVVAYNPTKPITRGGFEKLIGSSILDGWILSLLIALVITGRLDGFVAAGMYLIWFAIGRVLLFRSAQKQGSRYSSRKSLYRR